MSYKKTLIVLFFIAASICSAQENLLKISGKITDSLQQPIYNAAIIATPKITGKKIVYAISNTQGVFELQLLNNKPYLLQISCLGYFSITKEVSFSTNTSTFNLQLKTQVEELDEVVIQYDYKPIEKKKDTTTYKLNAFTNGNEFKMKDVLAKLPGIKIEDNTIKVHGKRVTKLLVEGKSFFDGSTKLAVENIPADVMDKIEIISNYKESELLRNLSDNEDLALNVVLKENKKDFAFGDLELGAGIKKFYTVHHSLFKYNPKSNISFIGDINNFNNNSLSFKDLSRLVGGSSNLLGRNSLTQNLIRFASNPNNRYESVTRFSALNFYHEFSSKLNISGYTIYSNNDVVKKSQSTREYFNNLNIIERRTNSSDHDDWVAMLNLKLDYNPSSNQKWLYHINYFQDGTKYNKQSISSSESEKQFTNSANGNNKTFSHNFEGYFRLNSKHTLGVAFRQNFTKSNSIQNWNSNATFLEMFIPLNIANQYHLQQQGKVNSHNLNLKIKDYWLAGRFFHLFYHLGLNYKNTSLVNNIDQLLNANEIYNFAEFYNNSDISLTDLNFGLGIKTQLGKFQFILEAIPHHYQFNRSNLKTATFFIEPKLKINYNIEEDIDLDFNYNYSNRYLDNSNYINPLKITSFNTVFKGNVSLLDERSHNFSLFYGNYKNVDDFYLDTSLDYSINNPVVNNNIIQIGINQLNQPMLLRLPEETLNLFTDFGLIFNNFSVEFEANIDWSKENQLINNNFNKVYSFQYSLGNKWLVKLNKTAQLSLEYEHIGYHITSGEKYKSTDDIISLTFESRFLKNFLFKTDFSSHFVRDFSNASQNYQLQNLYLGYAKPNKKFSYSLNFKNIYNNGLIVNNSFNDNLVISNQIFTLPRVLLFSLKYKF